MRPFYTLLSIGLLIVFAIATTGLLYSVISTNTYKLPEFGTGGGDVVGPHTELTVVGLQTVPLSDVTPTSGQTLGFDGSVWIPTETTLLGINTTCITPVATNCVPALSLNGDVTGTLDANTVVGLQTFPIISTTPGDGQVLASNGTHWLPSDIIAGPSGNIIISNGLQIDTANVVVFTNITIDSVTTLGTTTTCAASLDVICIPALGGDVTGTIDTNTVTKLQGQSVAATIATDGQVLAWDTVSPGWRPQGNPVYYGTGTQTNSGTNTVTLGPSATTLGATSAVAIGDATIATGIDSIAIGRGASAIIGLGGKNVAIGALASVYEIGQVAIGYNASTNFVGGGGAIAIGRNSVSTNTKTVALGDGAIASGVSSVAIGDVSSCVGATSVAIGKGAACVGSNAVAIGVTSVANSASSIAIGWSATANSIANAISIGQGASVPDASHGLALVLPAASVTPGALGCQLNAVSKIIPTWGSLYTTTAGAGPTTLTATSAYIQVLTTSQTVILPAVSTLELGFTFRIFNRSGGNVIVQSSGTNTIITLATFTGTDVTCILTSGTTAASWSAFGPVIVT